MAKERNHFYLYHVDVRRLQVRETEDSGANATVWERREIEACNLYDIAGKLKLPLSDIRYYHKLIIR